LPQGWSDNLMIASIGPQTSATCQQLLGRVDVEAGEYTMPGLVAAIVGASQEKPIYRGASD
jgi:uroporphyrinogen III methyltransferase / synthase